jgi:hypothetical protein
MTSRSRSRLSSIFLLGLMVAASCSSGKVCTTAACSSGAWMSVTFLSGPSAVVGRTVTMCRNDACHAGTVPFVPDSVGAVASMTFPDAPFVVGRLWQDEDHSVTLELEWRESGQVQDGDHYVVTLTEPSGATSTLVDKTVTYEKLAPNGEDCGPICWSAELVP